MDRKTCEEVFRRLDDFLDRRLGPEETSVVEQHLRVCEVCAREFRFEASVLRGLKHKLRQLAAPPGLLTRILSQLPAPTDGGKA